MKSSERLFSLDLLRGLDMFLLTVIGPIFWALHRLHPFSDTVTKQFRHPWGGFTLWDIIMPLFIFMCGAAVPYALSKRMADGRPTNAYWQHVLMRVMLLWFCGLLIQGDLASLDVNRLYPYSNTLQAIAAGYLLAAVVFAIPVRAVRILAPFVLAGLYTALLHLLGDYTTTGNFAFIVEKKILTALLPAGSQLTQGIAGLTADTAAGTSKFHYTWWLTSLMFGAMTLCGAQCAEILRSAWEPRRKALVLFVLGFVLLGIGWGLTPWIPPIKHIFTVSFTSQAMGWSTLLLAVLYAVTDIAKMRTGMGLFTLFGQCALTAYMVSHFFHGALRKAAEAIVQGVPHLLGADATGLAAEQVQHLKNVQGVVIAIAVASLLTFVLWIRRRLAGVPGVRTPDPVPRRMTPASAPEPKPAETTKNGEAEPVGPKMASKVRLQLHHTVEEKQAAPTPTAAPAMPNAGVIRLKPPNGKKPVPFQPEPPTVELKPRNG